MKLEDLRCDHRVVAHDGELNCASLGSEEDYWEGLAEWQETNTEEDGICETGNLNLIGEVK